MQSIQEAESYGFVWFIFRQTQNRACSVYTYVISQSLNCKSKYDGILTAHLYLHDLHQFSSSYLIQMTWELKSERFISKPSHHDNHLIVNDKIILSIDNKAKETINSRFFKEPYNLTVSSCILNCYFTLNITNKLSTLAQAQINIFFWKKTCKLVIECCVLHVTWIALKSRPFPWSPSNESHPHPHLWLRLCVVSAYDYNFVLVLPKIIYNFPIICNTLNVGGLLKHHRSHPTWLWSLHCIDSSHW